MKTLEQKQRSLGVIFVLPAFLFHLFLVTIPATSLIYYSMTDWNGFNVPEFVGINNFIRAFFNDSNYKDALRNNLVWILFFLTIPVVIGLLIALMLIRMKRSQMPFRSLFFMPYVIAPVVVGAVFSYFYSPYIGLSSIFKMLGIESLKNFAPLGSENQALFAVAFADHWHWWGFVMTLFLSALHQVNTDLYEAADIEGANTFQKFLSITFPSIIPTVVTLYMFIIIASFLTFDYVYVMTKGGPAGATEISATWIFKRTFVANEAGYGSALSLIVCGICIIVYFGFQFLQSFLNKKEIEI